MKLNISLDDKLVDRMESAMEELYLNRSGLISLALTQFLNQCDVISCMKRMSVACEKIASSGTLDDDMKREIDDLQRLSAFLLKSNK